MRIYASAPSMARSAQPGHALHKPLIATVAVLLSAVLPQPSWALPVQALRHAPNASDSGGPTASSSKAAAHTVLAPSNSQDFPATRVVVASSTWQEKIGGAILVLVLLLAVIPVCKQQGLRPGISVVAYICSVCLVKVFVKYTFNRGFKFPYSITAWHMLMTSIVACLLDPPRRISEARSTLLISIMKAASLGLCNMALLYGSTSFVSVISSTTPATTFIVEMARPQRPTFRIHCLVGIVFVCLGAGIDAQGEMKFSLPALLLALGACFGRSLKSVWSHDLLQVDMSPHRLVTWTSLWSWLIMFSIGLFTEGLEPYRQYPSLSAKSQLVFWLSTVAAVNLNILAIFTLKFLGPVQQGIFGQLEVLGVLFIAIIYLHETVTLAQWGAVALIMVGCLIAKVGDKPWLSTSTSQPEEPNKSLSKHGDIISKAA